MMDSMSPTRNRRMQPMPIGVSLAVALLCAWVGALPAADLGVRPVAFGSPGLLFDTGFDLEDLNTERAVRDADLFRWEFDQGLTLLQNGSVYHPEFLIFRGQARIAFRQAQSSASNSSAEISRNARLDTYRIRFDMLRNKPLSLSLGTGRLRNRIRGDRVVARDDIRNDVSLSASWKRLPVPVHARWQWLRNERGGFDDLEDRRFTFNLQANNVGTSHRVLLNVGRTRFELPARGVESGTRNIDLSLNRSVSQGWRLQSGVHWYRQESDRRFESLRGTARAARDLPMGFDVSSVVNGLRTDFSGERTDTGDATLAAHHRLFKSLDTRVSRRWSASSLQEGSLNSTATEASLNYRKNNPLGVLEYRFRIERLTESKQFDGEGRSTAQESLRFPADDEIRLRQPDIVLETVEVSDSLGVETLQRGIDYELIVEGRDVVLVRLQGGAIPPFGRVIVTYQFTLGLEADGGREQVENELSWRFPRGFQARVLGSRTYPVGDPRAFSFGAVSGHRTRYGLLWANSHGQVRWYREEALRDEIYTLDQRWLASARARWQPVGTVTGILSLGRSQVGRDEPRVDSQSFRLQLGRSVIRSVLLNAYAEVARRDLRDGELRTRGFGLDLDWNVRQTRISFSWSSGYSASPAGGIRDQDRVRLVIERRLL